MIILRLEAERLHRYHHLRLADLPERGVIALSGDNESGKSAIGEIICFALFGRTFVLAEDRIGKLVHWGAGEGAVTLRFRVKGQVYEVNRHLARDGDQSARLIQVDNPDQPLARAAGVNEAMTRLLGFGFDDFVETFYLAQREIGSPQPHSPALRAMIGAAPLETCAAELEAEIQAAEAALAPLVARHQALRGERERLSPEAGQAETLERTLAEITEREQRLGARLPALQTASDEYSRTYRRHGSHGARRALAGLFANIFLLAVLALGAFWAMLHFQPETWPVPVLVTWIEGLIAETGLKAHGLVMGLELILAVFLILFWLWLGTLALGLRRRRGRARNLAQELDRLDALEPLPTRLFETLSQTFGQTSGQIPSQIPGQAPGQTLGLTTGQSLGQTIGQSLGQNLGQPLNQAPGEGASALFVDRPDVERRARLRQRILLLEASAQEVCSAMEHEAVWLKRDLGRLGALRAAAEGSLARIHAEGQRHQQVLRELAELEKGLATERNRLATRRLARDLLLGAARALSRRFSEELRDMVSRALPQFTEGRYAFLEVDEGLQVRVYSSDKRNLLDLDEISNGTQRQIMLALRLGLSQELVARLVRDDQFVFLDEPFAFFDSRRMRGALKTLSELGGDLTQYWVVAQRFPQDSPISLEIACGQHPDSLMQGFPEKV